MLNALQIEVLRLVRVAIGPLELGDFIIDIEIGIITDKTQLFDFRFEICDRLCVIARGRLSPPKLARETNAETLGLLMAGSFIGAQGVERAHGSPAGIVDAN